MQLGTFGDSGGHQKDDSTQSRSVFLFADCLVANQRASMTAGVACFIHLQPLTNKTNTKMLYYGFLKHNKDQCAYSLSPDCFPSFSLSWNAPFLSAF